eukprot:2733391-Amphidinium_carterae.1
MPQRVMQGCADHPGDSFVAQKSCWTLIEPPQSSNERRLMTQLSSGLWTPRCCGLVLCADSCLTACKGHVGNTAALISFLGRRQCLRPMLSATRQYSVASQWVVWGYRSSARLCKPLRVIQDSPDTRQRNVWSINSCAHDYSKLYGSDNKALCMHTVECNRC